MSSPAAQNPVTVTLNVLPDGSVTLIEPTRPHNTRASDGPTAEAPRRRARFDAPFDANYSARMGFDRAFFGAGLAAIDLPVLAPALLEQAAPLLDGSGHELKYHNFSVVMHRARRLAVYSAANISAGQRYQMGRPSDVWRTDPRIAQDAQLANFYYANNQFDRGHLTRREDLEFGATPVAALQSAADTCHWTNCAPQHARFNQNKELWQGLEGYVLEQGILQGRLNVQVFTGPVFAADDPVYARFADIQYPVRFWKVLAALGDDNQVYATAYLLDQSDAIKQHGLATPPFGAFRTFQVTVAEIERLTQLRFQGADTGGQPLLLRERDPFVQQRRIRLRDAVQSADSMPHGATPGDYALIRTLDDIILR